jgi:hypothetical protein
MKTLIRKILTFVIITAIAYFFLSLCNWNFNVGEWNGFSRFLLGGLGIFTAIFLHNE